MIRWAVLASVVLGGGCVYYNSIYNAERSYEEAERLRRAGNDSLAAERYADVIRKAAEGYRREPDGEWADDALFLLGRARLRLGEHPEARAAFEAALEKADEETRSAILVFQALAADRAGDQELALSTVNEALRTLPEGAVLAEGHLLRGRLFLEQGRADAGWWDLDRAASVHDGLRVESALERLAWAVRLDAPRRAEEAAQRLLHSGDAASRLDTVARLAHAAGEAWGPLAGADLIAGADSAAWGRLGRARLQLVRAGLLHEAGDTAAAAALARRVTDGIDEGAAEARLWLGRIRLERTRDLAELTFVRRLLLPSGSVAAVAEVIAAVDDVERLTALGLEEPLAFFAAGEIARDALGAALLARGFFLAYADADPTQPWVPKALLAAVAVSANEGDRAWLRGRLEPLGRSPYVLAARGESSPGFEALEEELALRLRDVKSR